MIRYGNNILLTDLAWRIHKNEKSFQEHLRDGYLESARLRCVTLKVEIDGMLKLLGDLKEAA